jgi:hypothetical protein
MVVLAPTRSEPLLEVADVPVPPPDSGVMGAAFAIVARCNKTANPIPLKIYNSFFMLISYIPIVE